MGGVNGREGSTLIVPMPLDIVRTMSLYFVEDMVVDLR